MKSAEKLQEKKAGLSWKVKDWIAGYVFIAPVTIGLMVFYIWPFIQNFWFSFNDVNKFNVTHFIGLENFRRMFTEGYFPEICGGDRTGRSLSFSGHCRLTECQDKRKVYLPYPLLPSLRNDGSGCCHGLEVGF